MPRDVFASGGLLANWPLAQGVEAWWYDHPVPPPWDRANMPEPTVPWDQAKCMILWASDRAPQGTGANGLLRGNILNPLGGIIDTPPDHPTLKAAVEAFEGVTIAAPVRILAHYLSD